MTTRTWLITGASQGFGRARAESALAAGDTVVAAVRRPETVDDLAAEYPHRCAVTCFDVRDTSRAPDVVQMTVERFGRLDVLVNNAVRDPRHDRRTQPVPHVV
jgi:NAD(P)-dependent dehydrogenase (short-subunit alcohol dehydrogenase family)